MKKLIVPLVALGLAVGCGEVPTGTDGLTPDFGVAGSTLQILGHETGPRSGNRISSHEA